MSRYHKAHPRGLQRHRKRKAFFRWVGITMSSAVSLAASHGQSVKAGDTTKKKPGSAQFSFDDESWSSTPAPVTNPPSGSIPKYPWREAIVTTTFWIGEKPTANNPVPNHKSCWDPKWAENYGGTDSPKRTDRLACYIPRDFTPRQNPFYVALPYNDMNSKGHKPEAAQVIPWYSKDLTSSDKSVCKGRWIAIRHGNKVCYAQWEDAGPFRTDHAAYVFGNERPKPNLNNSAGLDVAPAVRDFLGIDDTDITDWKFVDFAEVPAGPWATFGDNNTFVINRRAAEEKAQLALAAARAASSQPTAVE